jgi:hypothetical protein
MSVRNIGLQLVQKCPNHGKPGLPRDRCIVNNHLDVTMCKKHDDMRF